MSTAALHLDKFPRSLCWSPAGSSIDHPYEQIIKSKLQKIQLPTAKLSPSRPPALLSALHGRRAHTLPPHRRHSNPHSASRTAPILLSRFPPLEGFARRPQAQAARHQCGRHPKPFTKADIAKGCPSLHILRPAAIRGNLSRQLCAGWWARPAKVRTPRCRLEHEKQVSSILMAISFGTS